MGAFYDSICLPDTRPDVARRALDRWLRGRGFRPSDEPVLFDLDAESERSAFVVWNDRWTVVLFSHWQEERRLIRELQADLEPSAHLLYAWVHDSDVWGWDVFDAGGFVGSYSSDARSYRSFDDGPEEPRPIADREALRARFGLDDETMAALHQLERETGAFPEDLCRQFCAALGVEPAASSYDDLLTGQLDDSLRGWRHEHRIYYHYEVAQASIDRRIDLHGLRLGAAVAGHDTQSIRISAEVQKEMEALRRKAGWTLAVLTPISWLARAWRRLNAPILGRSAWRRPAVPARLAVEVAPTETATRHQVLNPRHGVRLLLPPGVEPLAVSGKPASVCAFRCGATVVTCTARRLRHLPEVLRPPTSSKVVRDEVFRIAELQARHVLFELPQSRLQPTFEPRFLALHVVQTFRALYVFLYRFVGALDPRVEEAIRTAIRSFRLDEAILPPPRPAPRRALTGVG